jgi:hypothetical protein
MAQLPSDPSHLARVQTGGVGEDCQAVAPIGQRREDIDVVVTHEASLTSVTFGGLILDSCSDVDFIVYYRGRRRLPTTAG